MTLALIPLTAAGPLGRQWFPVATSQAAQDGPLAARLLGNDLVAWRSPNGTVVVAPDRCTHSKRPLSKGTVDGGRLVCAKHGWTFGDDGRCVFKPSGLPITDNAHLKRYPCTERHGLIWASLDDPETGVVDLPWEDDARFRRIHAEVAVWRCHPVHVMEALLARAVPGSTEVVAELPFVVHSVISSDNGAEHRRLVVCTPVDGRTALVTTVVWTSADAGDGAGDAAIADEATSDLDAVKALAEDRTAGGAPPGAGDPAGDSGTSSAWRRRLLDLVGGSGSPA